MYNNRNKLESHPLRYTPEYQAVLDNLTQLFEKLGTHCNLSERYRPMLQQFARVMAFELNYLKGVTGFILPYELPWFNMASYNPLLKTGVTTTCTATISLTVKLLYVAFSRCQKKSPPTLEYADLFLGLLREIISGGVYLYGYYLSKDIIEKFDDDYTGLAFTAMASVGSVIIGQQALTIPVQLLKRFQQVYKQCKKSSILPVTDDAPLLMATADPAEKLSRPQPIRTDYKEISQQDSLYLLLLTGLFLYARFNHADRESISTWHSEYLMSFIFALISYVITLVYQG